MIGALLAAGMLTLSLDGGGLLAQEASLRRSILPTFEVAAQLTPAGPFEVGLGYGLAAGRERFPGLDASIVHHRVPLRLGAGLEVGAFRLFAGGGPMLLLTRTRFDDGATRIGETTTQIGLVYGGRAETPVTALGDGVLLGRVVVEGQRRGRRNDVLLMLGVAYRP
jgi:hypothetical protein